METFALADNNMQSSRQTDFNSHEKYKTRLVRVDLAPRNGSGDVLRHGLRKLLRVFWFFVRTDRDERGCPDPYHAAVRLESNLKSSYQNTTQLAEIIARFLVALLARCVPDDSHGTFITSVKRRDPFNGCFNMCCDVFFDGIARLKSFERTDYGGFGGICRGTGCLHFE